MLGQCTERCSTFELITAVLESTVPFIESINKFQNPFRRPVATAVFLVGTLASIWLGIGATLLIDSIFASL